MARRLGRSSFVVQSQRAPTGGNPPTGGTPPPNPSRHQRSGSALPSPSPHPDTLDRRSADGPLGASVHQLQPAPVARLEGHKRSLSDNFDGGSRAGIALVEPMGELQAAFSRIQGFLGFLPAREGCFLRGLFCTQQCPASSQMSFVASCSQQECTLPCLSSKHFRVEQPSEGHHIIPFDL